MFGAAQTCKYSGLSLFLDAKTLQVAQLENLMQFSTCASIKLNLLRIMILLIYSIQIQTLLVLVLAHPQTIADQRWCATCPLPQTTMRLRLDIGLTCQAGMTSRTRTLSGKA